MLFSVCDWDKAYNLDPLQDKVNKLSGIDVALLLRLESRSHNSIVIPSLVAIVSGNTSRASCSKSFVVLYRAE